MEIEWTDSEEPVWNGAKPAGSRLSCTGGFGGVTLDLQPWKPLNSFGGGGLNRAARLQPTRAVDWLMLKLGSNRTGGLWNEPLRDEWLRWPGESSRSVCFRALCRVLGCPRDLTHTPGPRSPRGLRHPAAAPIQNRSTCQLLPDKLPRLSG